LPRKPADIAHVNLRIRENLRRRLEVEAKRHRFSLNSEMHARLEQSFYDKAHGDIWEIAHGIKSAWLRLEAVQEQRALAGLVMEALKELTGDADEIAERAKALAAPARKWLAIQELLDQQDREDRLSPDERLMS
jgi:hypothetical protein